MFRFRLLLDTETGCGVLERSTEPGGNLHLWSFFNTERLLVLSFLTWKKTKYFIFHSSRDQSGNPLDFKILHCSNSFNFYVDILSLFHCWTKFHSFDCATSTSFVLFYTCSQFFLTFAETLFMHPLAVVLSSKTSDMSYTYVYNKISQLNKKKETLTVKNGLY